MTQKPDCVDVRGLSEDAIHAVESLVTALREQASGSSAYNSSEEWCKALREWAASHRPSDTPLDWSRETIYAGRGE
jgi:hypothetical protein